ncbi:hypothetical protein N0V83_000307 [Neocucurbitaria cava]|uniref:C2H2-type domain-containing protein n=1 Tax=Neocucurbitaria cava TaxID=798079 RepID=A0A9W9CRW0_9PLEO|nr:hypothetical protein N0V83_000307 [Neocucurbitaria cava]
MSAKIGGEISWFNMAIERQPSGFNEAATNPNTNSYVSRGYVNRKSKVSPDLIQPCYGTRPSLYEPPQTELSIWDKSSFALQNISDNRGLRIMAQWKVKVLSLWFAKHRRAASDMELFCFFGLLRVSEDEIKRHLHRLLDQYQHSHHTPKTRASNSVTDQSFKDAPQARCGPDDVLTSESLNLYASFDVSADETTHSAPFAMDHTSEKMPWAFSQNVYGSNSAIDHEEARPEFHVRQSQLCNSQDLQLASSVATVPNNGCNDSDAFDLDSQTTVQHLFMPQLGSSHELWVPGFAGGQQELVPGVSENLRSFIQGMIRLRIEKGCGPIRGHEVQTGMYPCTLGCGRRFKTSSDLFRHEETVYPQRFWFCFSCGDPNNPSERHLFTREDKMRQHSKVCHQNENIKGDNMSNTAKQAPAKRRSEFKVRSQNDDDDSDDDDEENDDEENDDDDEGNKNEAGMKESSPGHSFHGHENNRPPDRDNGHAPDADGFLGEFHWDSPGFWEFPSNRNFHFFGIGAKSESPSVTPGRLVVPFPENVGKGGYSAVSQITFHAHSHTGTKYAVKRVSAAKHRVWVEQVIKALPDSIKNHPKICTILHGFNYSHSAALQKKHLLIILATGVDLFGIMSEREQIDAPVFSEATIDLHVHQDVPNLVFVDFSKLYATLSSTAEKTRNADVAP